MMNDRYWHFNEKNKKIQINWLNLRFLIIIFKSSHSQVPRLVADYHGYGLGHWE